MAQFTITHLVEMLRECAGEDEDVTLDGDILDVDFDDLGYDSLALYNTVSRIEREQEISLPDDVVGQATTPRALLAHINDSLAQPA